jgi:hypothetical protein
LSRNTLPPEKLPSDHGKETAAAEGVVRMGKCAELMDSYTLMLFVCGLSNDTIRNRDNISPNNWWIVNNVFEIMWK